MFNMSELLPIGPKALNIELMDDYKLNLRNESIKPEFVWNYHDTSLNYQNNLIKIWLSK